jgi:hypothetical protein
MTSPAESAASNLVRRAHLVSALQRDIFKSSKRSVLSLWTYFSATLSPALPPRCSLLAAPSSEYPGGLLQDLNSRCRLKIGATRPVFNSAEKQFGKVTAHKTSYEIRVPRRWIDIKHSNLKIVSGRLGMVIRAKLWFREGGERRAGLIPNPA